MLGTEISTVELARLKMINQAVPMADLDRAVDELVHKLLARSREVLAYTKRVLNRRVVDNLNSTLDPAVAYQLFNFRQQLAGS